MVQIILWYLSQALSYAKIKWFFASICFWIAWLIWWVDNSIYALLVAITLDYILGFSYAWKINTVRASKMKEGVFKYILYGIAIIIGNMLDLTIFKSSVEYWWHNLIIIYLCVNEALSIFKHLANFWVKLPYQLISKLEAYRDELNFWRRASDSIKWEVLSNPTSDVQEIRTES